MIENEAMVIAACQYKGSERLGRTSNQAPNSRVSVNHLYPFKFKFIIQVIRAWAIEHDAELEPESNITWIVKAGLST